MRREMSWSYLWMRSDGNAGCFLSDHRFKHNIDMLVSTIDV